MKTLLPLLLLIAFNAGAQQPARVRDTISKCPVIYNISCFERVQVSEVREFAFPENPSHFVLNRPQLHLLPYTDLRDAAAMSPGVYQRRRGDEISIGGARTSGTAYIIDGVHVRP